MATKQKHNVTLAYNAQRKKHRAFCSCSAISPEYDEEGDALGWAAAHNKANA
jgi:hypothetical protein